MMDDTEKAGRIPSGLGSREPSPQAVSASGFDPVRDPINAFFHEHYPALDEAKFAMSPILGGMREYRDYEVQKIFPRIRCADGFSMSVQGHAGAYSTPRDDFADHYTAVEIGFPSEAEPLLASYMEGGEGTDPTDTVYGYVPIEVANAVIEKHGGVSRSAA